MPDGKVERTVFTRPSATPITDAVTSAGIGLDALMPGAGLAMTAGAMGAGATNTRGGSMIAKAMTPDEIAKRNGDDLAAQFKFNPNAPLPTRPTEEQNKDFNSRGGTPLPPGSNTADPDSIASQAKAATNATAPQPITSAVKTEGTAMRSLTPTTSAVKQAATGAFDSAGASDKLLKIGSALGVETSETSRNSRKGGGPEGIGSNVAFDALYNAGESLKALSDTFAGLDPNLSKDEKTKKRGELFAAKYGRS